MTIRTGPGEPVVAAWRRVPVDAFARELLGLAPTDRRIVIAVNGRSGGGKTTLAGRLAEAIPGAAVVGTDDVAWNHSMFDWADLLADGVLRPFRRGQAVAFRPPPWDEHGRAGAIEVPAGVRVLVVEGVGASRRELADQIDVGVWVQSDVDEAERRGLARDIASGVNGDQAAATAFWHHWMSAEDPFHAADWPWERADAIVAGSGAEASGPDHVRVACSGDRATGCGRR